MDPLTAGLVALSAFNQFLLTPPGQKFATDFENVMGGILNVLHIHIANQLPAAPTPKTS